MEDPSGPRERNNDDMIKEKDKIFDYIVRTLTQTLNMSPTDISMDLSLRDDLILDSLQLYELVIDVEEAYDIRLPDEELDEIVTIEDVVNTVYGLTAN
ncbi:MAG: acyl carrier protein [Clostridiales bacterium]|nr:acyl carrier protein [Clostridiales bacterium]